MSVLCTSDPGSRYKGRFHARKLPFAQEEGERGLGDGRLGIGLLRRPVVEGPSRVGLSRFRFRSKVFGLSHHVPDFCTKSRFLVYSVYVVIFTCQ
jgi:hypothetical protein